MIDIIGLLWTLAVYGDADPETGLPIETVPSVLLEGWHVNITPALLSLRPELEPFVVTPSPLLRVWSGDDPMNPTLTVALQFEDEAEALAFFPA